MKERLKFHDIVKSDYDLQKEKLNDFIDFSFDDKLKNLTDLNYLPWIGNKLRPRKTLIVGESLYLWKESNKDFQEIYNEAISEIFLRKTVSTQGLCLNKDKKTHKFYRGIERLFAGKKDITENERFDFWTGIIFHQFVQEPMDNHKIRPTQQQYKVGASVLKDIIKLLNIELCIFLGSDISKVNLIQEVYGKENFAIKDSENPKIKIGNTFGRKRIAKYDNKEVEFVFVRHPSAFFSWKVWNQKMIK